MAKFTYDHPHTKHLVLQGAKDKGPYAVFMDGVFETDDAATIKRLEAYEGIERVPDDEETDEA